MKRYAFVAGVVCLSASFVKAQEISTPVFEVGATYSFVHGCDFQQHPEQPTLFRRAGF
jgi:hypothetical protein